ncbi:PAS domain-containing protein [Mucilaginibacter sp. PAMB04168]|uniref:PAS domain-containing protein n=1 Tax=Mucilaginibacter sp. PAMB04168 TaxID=3138567 RepID=UPI0031F66624
MVNALPIGAAIFTGPEHTIGAVNPQMLAIWSKEAGVTGMKLLDAIPEIRDQGFFALLTDVYTSGNEYHNPDGQAELLVDGQLQTKYFDFSFKPLRDDGGRIYGVVNTAIDITERTLNSQQLQQVNEELNAVNGEMEAYGEELRTAYDQLEHTHDTLVVTSQQAELLLESAPVAVGVIDAINFKIHTGNTKLLELWGIDNQAIGKPLGEVLSASESEFLTNLILKVRDAGHPLYGNDVKTMIERGAEWVTTYFNFVYQPIRNGKGEVISVQIVANEVTDQRNAKADVDAVLVQLHLAQKAAHFGVFDLDVVNDKLYWDERTRKIFGVDPTKAVGYSSDFAEGLHPDDRERTLQAVRDAYDQSLTGGVYDIEYRVVDASNGNICWVRAVGQVYFNSEAEPQRFVGTVVDITGAVEARQKLEASERQQLELNEELSNINEELSAVNEEYQAGNEELTATNEELRSIQEERALLHQELTIKEERLRFAMKAADVGTWDLDIVNNLVSWDERCKELYGFSKDDVVPYEQVLKYMHPDDRPKVNEAVMYALDPASHGSYDIEFRTIGAEDQRLRWLHCCGKAFFDDKGIAYRFSGIAQDISAQKMQADELASTLVKVKEKEEQLTSAKEAAQLGLFDWDLVNKVYNWDARFREIFNLPDQDSFQDNRVVFERLHPDDVERVRQATRRSQTYGQSSGGRYDIQYRISATEHLPERWVRAIGKTLFSEEGTPLRFIGSVLDITEQKQEEQRRIDFIGIVSHELRSPLTSLSGYLQMLEMSARKNNDQFTGNVSAKAKRQVGKMSSMITGFLDVARMGEGKIQINHKPFDMAELVKAAESESLATITTHTVIYHPVEHTPVLADEDKIEQVLINLINNAVKYSPQGTIINVSATTRDGQVRVCVKDEGMGIPAKDLPHVFNRFYRVEGEHMKTTKGFGIGLYLCREIIERHGGKIGAESELGIGSTFWFEIPVTH